MFLLWRLNKHLNCCPLCPKGNQGSSIALSGVRVSWWRYFMPLLFTLDIVVTSQQISLYDPGCFLWSIWHLQYWHVPSCVKQCLPPFPQSSWGSLAQGPIVILSLFVPQPWMSHTALWGRWTRLISDQLCSLLGTAQEQLNIFFLVHDFTTAAVRYHLALCVRAGWHFLLSQWPCPGWQGGAAQPSVSARQLAQIYLIRGSELGNTRLGFCFGAQAGLSAMFWIRAWRGTFLSTYGIALGLAFLPRERWVTGIHVNTHFYLFCPLFKCEPTLGPVDVRGWVHVLCLSPHTHSQAAAVIISSAWEEWQEEGWAAGCWHDLPSPAFQKGLRSPVSFWMHLASPADLRRG